MAASFQPPSHLFERNISLNDLDLALNVREIVRKDVVVPAEATKHRHLGSSTSYSLVLPSFQNLEEEFRKFVFSFLVDGHILRELETARRLNWCGALCRMVTVNTLGDGNCLMHAASIGMWAVNDRYQTLRKTVYEALVEDVEGTRFYHGRWKSEEQRQILLNHIGGYERSEEQWSHEWEEVIRHISQTEFPYGPNGAQFGSLEEIHIFVLANILRRTIIVVSDETLRGHFGDSYAPINFGGVYLPLLWDSVDCVKVPLVIGYADGHFTAVVSIEDGKLDLDLENQVSPRVTSPLHAVPLVKYDGTPLNVHFLYDDEVPLASDRLRQYLDCARVPFAANPEEPRSHILVAKLHFAEQPACIKDLIEGYFAKAREEYSRASSNRQLSPQFQPGTQQPALQIVHCQTEGCEFFGSTETGNRCSKCLNEYLRSLGTASEPRAHVLPGQIPTGQQPNPPTARASSVSVNLPPANFTRCSTTGCKYTAVANRAGYCERCFEAERSAEELAASMNHVTLASAKPCANRNNGCEFFGLPQHHDLCSRCYRSFCVRMESTLGVSSPTGLPPPSPTATPANMCKTQGCPFPGVPALFDMCVECYTKCIHSFITSEGRSVGTAAHISQQLPPPPPPPQKKMPLPTGAGKKGVLCASPGCVNEGVFQYGDLCLECYQRKSGPSPQMRTSPVVVPTTSAASAANVSGTQPPVSTLSSSATVASAHHLPSASPRTSGYRYCSNPTCLNEINEQGKFVCSRCQPPVSSLSSSATVASVHHLPSPSPRAAGRYCSNPTCLNEIVEQGKFVCSRCESWLASLPHVVPPASLQLLRRPVDVGATGGSTATSMPQAQQTPTNSSAFAFPVPTSSQEIRTSHQATAATGIVNPSTPAQGNKCINGCQKPPVEDTGLCEQCYLTALQFELNREPVRQPKRQQSVTPPITSSSQVEQRNINTLSSSARSAQPTATSAAAKKGASVTSMPCTATGCLRFGTPEKNGYCDECFLKVRRMQLSAPPFKGSQQHSSRSMEPIPRMVGNFVPSSCPLKDPVQVCQTQSPPYGARVRRHDAYSGNAEDDVHGRKCRGTNCKLFGTPETNGYCSRCFLESTIPQSGPASIPDFPSEVSSLSLPSDHSLPEQCRVTGCDNFAAFDRHGHCKDCFKRFYPEVIYREKFTQRQISEISGGSN